MSVRKNLIYYIINNISAVLFPFITVPYVSRVLGIENIGIVGFATTYAQYFALIAALGIPLYGIKEIAKRRDSQQERNRLFSELFSLNLISGAICSIIYIATILLIPDLYKEKNFLFVAGTMVYLSAFSFDWFFNGRENFRMITIRSVAIKVISIILLFLIVRNEQDAIYYCSITALAIVLNQLWNFIYIVRKEITISFRGLSYRPHLKPLFILLSTNIAVSIYTMLDTIMLGFMSSYVEVGYYTSAIKITRLLLPFAIASTYVLMPKISYAFSENDKETYSYYLQRSFNLITLFATPISFGLIIIAPSFVPLFFGPEFEVTIIPMQILSTIILFVGLSNFFGLQVLVSSGREGKQFRCILLGTIVNFTINLIVIPRFGAIGASIASAIGELLIVFATAIVVRKYIRLKIRYTPLIQSLLSCVPMIVLFFIIPPMKHIETTVILVAFGALSYFFIQLFFFKNEECREIYNRIKNVFKFNIKWT